MQEELTENHSTGEYRHALIGNMNVGKTSIFKSVTTKKVRPLNIPGSTVTLARGQLKGDRGVLYDTPGLASIFSDNEDERAARKILLDLEDNIGINGIIIVADAENLKRSIALALQYSEFGLPMLFNINMMDEAISRGIEIDTERLSTLLGVTVTTTIAPEGLGIKELMARLGDLRPLGYAISYSPSLERYLANVQQLLGDNGLAARGMALLLLHHDADAGNYVENRFGAEVAGQCLQQVSYYYNEEPNHARHLLAELYNGLASRIAEVVQSVEPPSRSSGYLNPQGQEECHGCNCLRGGTLAAGTGGRIHLYAVGTSRGLSGR